MKIQLKSKLTTLATACIIAMGTSGAYAQERYVIQVDNKGKGIVKALARQNGGQIKVDGDGFFAAEFSGLSLDDVKGVLNNPHVKLVEVDQIRAPLAAFNDDLGNPMLTEVTPYAVYQSEANKVSFEPNAGIKVCVIDSGFDLSHPDFSGNVDGTNDDGTGNWFEPGTNHGTHVTGTIAALKGNGIGVVGMAPGVDLHIIKVFTAAGYTYSSNLSLAAQGCADAGANIINMSLGGGAPNSTEENAFKAFRDAGGLVVAAAGNDGNTTRSYPAGYSSIMMIGANDANNEIAAFSQHPSCDVGRRKNITTDETICVEVTAGGVNTISTFPVGTATSSGLSATAPSGTELDYISSAMENTGIASAATYYMGTAETLDAGASDKVCVIDRGVISFFDKVNNCQQSGGVAAVIINNEAGLLNGTLGTSNTTSIPAVGAALEDRTSLLDASNMTVSVTSSDYGFLNGTSMATPAVAGVAALVWSNHPNCSGEEIRTALKTTAQDAGAAGKDIFFGHGIVKAAAANAYLTANPCAIVGEPPAPPPSSGDFSMTVNGYKNKGSQFVDVSWSGASTTSVDVYRNGVSIATVSGTSYTDALNTKGGGTYTYKVCEANTQICTASAQVTF